MSEQITPNPLVPTQVIADGLKFPRYINNLGIIPTSYKDSMTYYETLAWLCKYLEDTVIPTVNQNGEAVQELQNLYIQLEEYCEHYFENLDVQEEINNKLDDMVEDGTLQEIIGAYLETRAVFGFDNVDSMKNAENLIDGSYAKTLGFYSVNDGGNAVYKIREITNADVVDNVTIIPLQDETLVAELIKEKEMNIECFGVVGDGETDESDIIQLALNYTNIRCAKNNKSYITTKTMYINHSLDGNDNTFVIADFEDMTFSSGRGVFIVNQPNIIVKNCKFIGNYTDYEEKIPYITENLLPPILSFMDGSDGSQAICCYFEKTNGHTIEIYGNTVKNILVENCTAIDCGVGVGIEQIEAGNNTPSNITINNFYAKCNNGCQITSGTGITVNNCYFESNGLGKSVVTTNESYHDTHVDFSGCKFSHTGVGTDIGYSRCLMIDSYSGVKNVFVNLSGCVLDGDISGVRCVWTSSHTKTSFVSCEIKGCLAIGDGSSLDLINSKLTSSVNNQNIIIVNGETCLINISNSEITVTDSSMGIWNKGVLSFINSKITSPQESIIFKANSKGAIINSTLSKLLNTEAPYGVTLINSNFTNDTRFITNMGSIIGAVSNTTDLANLPATLSNCSMILVIGTKKIAYKYGTQWFYVDGTYISG